MKAIGKLVAALGLGLALQAAQAAIITAWDYQVTSLWTSASPAGVIVTPTTLTWGTSTGQGPSSLTIANPAPGVVDTYVGTGIPPSVFAADGSSITHANHPINGTSLASAVLNSSLVLKAKVPVPSGTPTGPAPISLNIAFEETPNQAPCAVSGSPTPCNDIFVLLSPLQNQSFSWDSDGPGGDPAQNYFVNVFPKQGILSTLEDAACIAAGVSPGCTGFTTAELQDTTLPFAFTVSTEPVNHVPEPGSLALVGLGLGLLSVMGRRRSR
jgi:hypothetical protein